MKKHCNSTKNQLIEKILNKCTENNLNGFIFFLRDPFGNDTINENFNIIKKISGFSGSYAVLLITHEKNFIFSDARYAQRIENELEIDAEIKFDNFRTTLNQFKKIGFDGMFATESDILHCNHLIEKSGFLNNFLETDLTNWNFEIFDDQLSDPYETKLEKTIQQMKNLNVDYYIIPPESTSWLLNIRSNAIKHYPIVLGYSILDRNGNLTKVFLNQNGKISDFQNKFLIEIKKIKNYKIALDGNFATCFIKNNLTHQNVVKIRDIIMELKKVKSETEIHNMRIANLKDSLMFMKLLYYIKSLNGVEITEKILAEKILELKQENNDFIDESFDSIVAFDENTSIIHHSPTDKVLKNFIMIDTGSHYKEGTTDITRTFSVNKSEISEFHKKIYTIVLKSHIALANAKFKKNISGAELNIIPRKIFWDNGYDFVHGTSHGIGVLLNVHEPYASISSHSKNKIQQNMILSNEPGLYFSNNFGVRIENAILTKELDQNFCNIETISYIPFDRNLIEKSLLTKEEINFINTYYKISQEKLIDYIKNRLKTNDQNEKLINFIKNEFATI